MALSPYARAYDANGEPPRKPRIFISDHGEYGLRCNAVGGKYGYGLSFPVKRQGDTYIEMSRDWSLGAVVPTGRTLFEALR